MTAVILGLGIFTIRYWDTQLPVWGFIVVCFGMGALLIIPEGLLEGTTNPRGALTFKSQLDDVVHHLLVTLFTAGVQTPVLRLVLFDLVVPSLEGALSVVVRLARHIAHQVDTRENTIDPDVVVHRERYIGGCER